MKLKELQDNIHVFQGRLKNKEIAKKSGYSGALICQAKKGKVALTIESLEKIYRAMGCELTVNVLKEDTIEAKREKFIDRVRDGHYDELI